MKAIRKVFVLFAAIAALCSLLAFGAAAEEAKAVVCYFSNSGHTEAIAKMISESTGAELFRIIPKEPYDLDKDLGPAAKRDPNSRVQLENKDDKARPEVDGRCDAIDGASVVFIGYPVWFGNVPKVVRSFLESYDLSGKTLVTFGTSGSSELNESSASLRSSIADSTKLVIGKSFRDVKPADIAAWVNGLEIEVKAK